MANPDDIYDQWLVLRCQDGDRDALAELVERWQSRLHRQAMRLVDGPGDAEEVVQAAWLAIVRGVGRLHDPACFRRWAYQIVTNKCADWIRARQRQRAKTTPLTTEPVDPNPTVEDRRDDIALLRRAMSQLPTDKRTILSMFYLDGMSLQELAEALLLPVGTVKSRLHYARRELKATLQRSHP